MSRRLRYIYVVLLLCGYGVLGGEDVVSELDVREVMPSIFKLHVVSYRHDYRQPWQGGGTTSGTGTGFLIAGGYLLTCGHVVADAVSVEVQPNGSAERFAAKVRYTAYDSDLALLELEDPTVLEGLPVLEFADAVSELGDEVFAIGFPMGGTRLSLTRGIVSRVDHSVYVFSGVDERLVVQIDAAINPGNSGGPVVNRENQVVGVAFQGLPGAQALGYVVPVSVIRHFLEDVQNPPYHGRPQLHLEVFELRNPAMRASFGLPISGGGAVVTAVSRYCSSRGKIQPGDVLLRVDDVPIQQDGTVSIDGNVLPFHEIVERKQWGESVRFGLLRDDEEIEVAFGLTPEPHPFIFRRLYDHAPEYLMVGGLCFVPLTRNYMMTLGNRSENDMIPIMYFFDRARFKDDLGDRRQILALTSILPHPINTYAGDYEGQILRRVNGVDILDLADFRSALSVPDAEFHVLAFEGLETPLVLDAKNVPLADEEVRHRYGVMALENIR